MNIEKHIEEIRKDFPILNKRINDKKIVYFDNAASSQKPKQVVNKIKEIYENYYANVHRGLHYFSEKSTEEYDLAREEIASFFNIDKNHLIFTNNSTHGINLVAYAHGLNYLKEGDKIVVSLMEHNSNLLPWQWLAKSKKLKVEYLHFNKEGKIPEKEFDKLKNAKFLAIVHVSNVLGTKNPVEEMIKIVHEEEGKVLVDASQSVPHIKINIEKINPDFFVFTGHKMLGPTGIGGLYIKEDIMNPFFFGGDMVKDVSLGSYILQKPPLKYEAGTPNFVGAIALGEAIKYLKKLGIENIMSYEKKLNAYFLEYVDKINLNLVGGKDRENVFSFTVKGKHHSDIALYLNENNIFIRSGMHCAHVLHKYLDLNGSARASLYFYNTFEEIDYFFEVLRRIL